MAIYEVVQMHDSTDTTKLQFPKVPLEAIIQDPDHRSAPFGTPARVMELLSMSATAPTPTKADQHYFNTATRKIHTSSASGQTFVWDTNGSEPQAGVLYKVASSGNSSEGETLYVKSIDAQGEGLHLLGIWQYQGPFRAVGVRSGTTWVVAVEAGNVYAGWNEYGVPRHVDGITLTSGQSLYLVGSAGSPSPTFQYTTDATATGDFRVRIAYNSAGNLVQCQYGDIHTAALQ